MPQVVRNEILPVPQRQYINLSGAILNPFANQLGEGVGYAARHALFGNTPQEDYTAALGEAQTIKNDEEKEGLARQYNLLHPDEDPTVAGKAYNVRGLDDQEAARVKTSLRPTDMIQGNVQGAAYQGVFGQDHKFTGLEGQTNSVPLQPGTNPNIQDIGSNPFAVMPGQVSPTVDALGVTPQPTADPSAPAPGAVHTIEPDPATQAAQQAVSQLPQQSSSPAPTYDPTKAANNAAMGMQAAAANPAPAVNFQALSPDTQNHAQMVLARSGAALQAINTIGQGQYSVENAHKIAYLYSLTDKSIDSMNKKIAAETGSDGKPAGIHEAIGLMAIQTAVNPAMMQQYTAEQRNRITAAATQAKYEFDTLHGFTQENYKQVANTANILGLQNLPVTTLLAARKAEQDFQAGAQEIKLRQNQEGRTQNEFNWQKELRPEQFRQLTQNGDLKDIQLKFTPQQYNQSLRQTEQEIQFASARNPLILRGMNQSELANLITIQEKRFQIENTPVINQMNLKAKQEANRVLVLEKLASDSNKNMTAFLDKARTTYPADGPDKKALLQAAEVHRQTAETATNYLKTIMAPPAPGTPDDGQIYGSALRGYLNSSGQTIDKLTRRYWDEYNTAHPEHQQDGAALQNLMSFPSQFSGKTSLYSWAPGATSPINNLPVGSDVLAATKHLASLTPPGVPIMPMSAFLETKIQTANGKMAIKDYVKDPIQQQRMFTLWYDTVRNGRASQ